MNMMLEIIYEHELRQPEYPMGEPAEFKNMREFIEFNLEQIDEVMDNDPSLKSVAIRLLMFEFEVYEDDGIIYVKVRV